MARPKLRKPIRPQKILRRRRAYRHGKAKAADPDGPSHGDAAGPRSVPKPREDPDAYGRYLDELFRSAPPLLTFEQELQLGKEMDGHVGRAVENMLRDLVEATDILNGIGKEINALKGETARQILRRRAARCLERLNPDRLKGQALKEQLRQRMRTTEAGKLFGIYAEPEGIETREKLIKSNLRLVISMARRYDNGRMPLAEIVQEGNIGLMHVAMIYDYRMGYRFSTVAAWWIRHEIGRAIADKARGIRIPVHVNELYDKVTRLYRTMTSKLGREPSDEEVAEELLGQRIRGEKKPKAFGVLLAKVQDLATYPRVPVSFDQPLRADDGDGETMLDVFEHDEAEKNPGLDRIRKERELGRLKDALRGLKPIEYDIIVRRFGIGDDQERTLKEISVKYKLTRERIRQIQLRALEKLRMNPDLRRLVQEPEPQEA